MSVFAPRAGDIEMNEVQVKEGPLEVAARLSYRLSGSYQSEQGGWHTRLRSKHTTPKWRPQKCQVGVVYGREKVRLQRSKDSSWA